MAPRTPTCATSRSRPRAPTSSAHSGRRRASSSRGPLPDLARSLSDRVQPEESETEEEAISRWLQEFSVYRKKDYRRNLNRFMGFVAQSSRLLDDWFPNSFQVEYAALELGWLSNKSLRQKLHCKVSAADVDAPVTIGRTAVSVDNKALRSVCQNSLVVSVLYLAEPANRKVLLLGSAASRPVLQWHTEQSRMVRSVDESFSWLPGQCSGMFMDHIKGVLAALEDEDALRVAGFAGLVDMRNSRKPRLEDVWQDDEIAELFGSLAWALASARQERCAWMLNLWPVSFVRLLGEGKVSEACLRQVKADYDAYTALEAQQNRTQLMTDVLRRFPFGTTSVRQIVQGLISSGWKVSPLLAELLKSRFRAIAATQLLEDCNNVQKDEKANQGCAGTNRFRTPQRCFSTLLATQPEARMHRFSPLKVNQPLTNKALVLCKERFVPTVAHQSLKLSDLVSTKQDVGWFSPSAANVGLPCADAAMLLEAQRQGTFRCMDGCWAGFFAQVAHTVCFRMPETMLTPRAPGMWA